MNSTAFEIALALRGIHTTKALSDITGISRQTLTPIRFGRKDPSQETAEQIRNALNLSPDEYANIFPMQAAITAARDKYAGA